MSVVYLLCSFSFQGHDPLPNPFVDPELSLPLPNDLHNWLYERIKYVSTYVYVHVRTCTFQKLCSLNHCCYMYILCIRCVARLFEFVSVPRIYTMYVSMKEGEGDVCITVRVSVVVVIQ